MAVTPVQLIAPKIAENSQHTQYTSTGLTTIIDKFTATNYGAAAAALSVNLVTLADTAGNNNLVVKAKMLQAGETYTFPEVVGHILGVGGFISTLADTATSISIMADGRQVTS
jgi:hypothetical protein